MTNYKVFLKSIKLFGYHGVLKEEQEKGQEFRIDVKYKFEKKNAADDIKSTLDYSEVLSVVKQVFEAKRYNLLENLSQDIASRLIVEFGQISQVKVSISKQNPPINGQVAEVTVSTKKNR